MTTFTIGQPVSTRTPSIVVDAGLKPGVHRFQLEVIDSSEQRSRPVLATVTITMPDTRTPPGGGIRGTGTVVTPAERVTPTPTRRPSPGPVPKPPVTRPR